MLGKGSVDKGSVGQGREAKGSVGKGRVAEGSVGKAPLLRKSPASTWPGLYWPEAILLSLGTGIAIRAPTPYSPPGCP